MTPQRHSLNGLLIGVAAVCLSGCALLYEFERAGAGGSAASTNTNSSSSSAPEGLGNGAVCSSPTACASGHCVAGVCCDAACSGACESCDGVSGEAGTCRVVKGRVCQAPSCTNNTQTSGVCNGVAVDCPVVSQMCTTVCNGAVCEGNCASDADCATSHYCLNFQTCVPKQPNGSTCSLPSACASGACVDSVCCDEPCAGTCQSCNLAGSEGTCLPTPKDTVSPADCAPESPDTCGRTGACNGAGACAMYPDTQQCALATCMGSSLVPSRTCDGNGLCKAVNPVSCGAYTCEAGACQTACTDNSDCVSLPCGGNGQCGKPNGATCSPGECASGFCVDGVCCDTACAAPCFSCQQFYTSVPDGTCAPINSGDPFDQCPGCEVCSGGQCFYPCGSLDCCCTDLGGVSNCIPATDTCSGGACI